MCLCVKDATLRKKHQLSPFSNIKVKARSLCVYEVRKGGKRRKEANKPKNMKYAKVAHAVFPFLAPQLRMHSFITLKFTKDAEVSSQSKYL